MSESQTGPPESLKASVGHESLLDALEEPAYFLEIGFVIKNLRGVIVAISNGAKVILGNVGGQHYTSFTKGEFLQQIAKADGVCLEAKPVLNLLFTFIHPITGRKSFVKMDKYPLFDEQGNVSAVGSYAQDCTDELLLSNAHDSLRPQVTGANLIADVIASLNRANLSDAAKRALATIESNAVIYKKTLTNMYERCRKPRKTVEEPGCFYSGKLILYVLSKFAEMAENSVSNHMPVISLEIEDTASLYCQGDRALFELIFHHALECSFVCNPPKVHVGITNVDGRLRIKVMWFSEKGLVSAARAHIKAVERTFFPFFLFNITGIMLPYICSKSTFQVKVDKTDIVIVSLFIPLAPTPFPLHPKLIEMLASFNSLPAGVSPPTSMSASSTPSNGRKSVSYPPEDHSGKRKRD